MSKSINKITTNCDNYCQGNNHGEEIKHLDEDVSEDLCEKVAFTQKIWGIITSQHWKEGQGEYSRKWKEQIQKSWGSKELGTFKGTKEDHCGWSVVT